MSDIATLLSELREGDKEALEDLFNSLHQELKNLARRELYGHSAVTLSPTALVNEAWIKLNAANNLSLQDRRHFFACAAKAMRHIAIDAARAAMAKKRGQEFLFVTLTESGIEQTSGDLVALDGAMQDLDAVDRELRNLVELRFFAGLSMDDIAELTGRSARSLYRDWTRARAFLHAQLQEL